MKFGERTFSSSLKLKILLLFDCITHDKAENILVGNGNINPCENWHTYYQLPVLTDADVVTYYDVPIQELEAILAEVKTKCELKVDGLLILRGSALQDAIEHMDITASTTELVLFPARATLKLCLFLAGDSASRVVDGLWRHCRDLSLDKSTSIDWQKTYDRGCIKTGRRFKWRTDLQIQQIQAQNYGVYPHVQHFGEQACRDTWDALWEYEFEHPGKYPPPVGERWYTKT